VIVRWTVRMVTALMTIVSLVGLLAWFEPLRFAVMVTIREILRVHIARWYIEAGCLAAVLLGLGEATRAVGKQQEHLPFWRQGRVWAAVGTAGVSGVGLGVFDAARRGLSLGGGVVEAVWAGACLAVLTLVCCGGQSSAERVASDTLAAHGRVAG
jgi:hypothetical protein